MRCTHIVTRRFGGEPTTQARRCASHRRYPGSPSTDAAVAVTGGARHRTRSSAGIMVGPGHCHPVRVPSNHSLIVVGDNVGDMGNVANGADSSSRVADCEILDATCGGRSIWCDGQKEHENALYIDRREEPPGFTGQEGRTYSVEPDQVQDFRDLPYPDESFNLVVFDPPHLMREDGMERLTGYITKSYGALHAETWQADLRAGFKELWRVLAPGGTLVFKFADNDVDFRDVLKLAPVDPLFGTTTKKSSKVENRWFVFYKEQATD